MLFRSGRLFVRILDRFLKSRDRVRKAGVLDILKVLCDSDTDSLLHFERTGGGVPVPTKQNLVFIVDGVCPERLAARLLALDVLHEQRHTGHVPLRADDRRVRSASRQSAVHAF